ARANAQGYYLAEAALAAHLARITGRPVAHMIAGLDLAPAAADVERLTGAARTAISDRDTAPERLALLARAEPVRTAQAAMSRAMDSRPEVIGWRRETEPDACEACEAFAGDSILPTDMPMWHHPGCMCVQQPVTEGDRP